MVANTLINRYKIPSFITILFPVFCLSAFASIILFLRMLKGGAGEFWYLSFGWNLFLAWIPLFIILYLRKLHQQQKLSQITLYIGLGVWLLFLPNSPYLITDLLHLKYRDNPIIPIWFDTLFFFTFALAGLQAGLFSLYSAQQLLNQYFKPKLVWGFILLVLVLTSFGIYLGRELRWNSWDIIAQPLDLIYSILHQIMNPTALQFTLVYAIALSIFYLMFLQNVKEE
jgi:uncharacterized membrane protein